MATDIDKLIANMESFNRDVRSWAYRNRGLLKSNASRFTKGKSQTTQRKTRKGNTYTDYKLKDYIRTSVRKNLGEVDSIAYKFPRHGVFVQKGVGRSHGIDGAPLAATRVKTLGSRKAQDWFNGTLNREVPKLADIVANHKADEAVVNAAGMKIG